MNFIEIGAGLPRAGSVMRMLLRRAWFQVVEKPFHPPVESLLWPHCLSETEIGKMNGFAGSCEISIVIPVFNEFKDIIETLRCLALQRNVDLEVVICDGGSTDGTVELIRGCADTLPFPVIVVTSEKGRARQMNAGAGASRGEYILFLHADSRFQDEQAVRKGLDAVKMCIAEGAHHRYAGRFPLRFRRRDDSRSRFYYFLECKARLDREGCIHGDQGFLICRGFFFEAGAFDESCSMMEDTLFAEKVRACGSWVLLPEEVWTSARRFEAEGESARHFLNGILMTLSAIGREDFIRRMRGVYACQRDAGPLSLSPFLAHINLMLTELTWRERRTFWRTAGRYACENSWQTAFCMDVLRNFRKGIPPGQARFPCLRYFDHRWSRCLSCGPMPPVAAFLAWMLFHCLRLTFGALPSRTETVIQS
jgi:rSAM/selenodomain-associated transferase 2